MTNAEYISSAQVAVSNIEVKSSEECKKSVEQRAEQKMTDLNNSIKRQQESIKKKVGETTKKVKDSFNTVVESFSGITGYQNPEDVDLDTILDPLISAFQPILEIFNELKISIPGLSQMMSLLTTAKSYGKQAENAASDIKSQLSGKDRNISDGLNNTATSIMMSISMMFINLIISAIAKIIDLLLTIATLGLDPNNLPYPLNLISKAVKALPKIISLAVNLPTNLDVIYKAICIKFNTIIDNARIPTSVDDISCLNNYVPCPDKAQQELQSIVDANIDSYASKYATQINSIA